MCSVYIVCIHIRIRGIKLMNRTYQLIAVKMLNLLIKSHRYRAVIAISFSENHKCG